MTMPISVNSKILLSTAAIMAAAALIIGATFAFFSDTETSEDNILQAGALDLKIDSEAHYAGLVCEDTGEGTEWAEEATGSATRTELIGEECKGTWELKDLEEGDTFFELFDLKPGDSGENTISLHVFDNDAWGKFVIDGVNDDDNTCTEPESEVDPADDPECSGNPNTDPGQNGLGELSENMSFHAWLDQGSILGFQCANPTTGTTGARCSVDPTEGDNIQQCGIDQQCAEPNVITPGPLDPGGETHNIWEGLALYRASLGTACDSTDLDGDGHAVNGSGQYLACHGLADDGRLVGSATYYFGLAWDFDEDAGNEAQTDSIDADISFNIVQQRNNPGHTF